MSKIKDAGRRVNAWVEDIPSTALFIIAALLLLLSGFSLGASYEGHRHDGDVNKYFLACVGNFVSSAPAQQVLDGCKNVAYGKGAILDE